MGGFSWPAVDVTPSYSTPARTCSGRSMAILGRSMPSRAPCSSTTVTPWFLAATTTRSGSQTESGGSESRCQKMNYRGALALLVLLIGAWFALLAWRNSRARRNGHFESVASAAARYRERVASPDLDGLEQHLGHSLPESFRALYRDRSLITSENIVIAVPKDHPWPGCEGVVPVRQQRGR